VTARTSLVLRAEFSPEGDLLPGLAGGVIRTPEARRVGLALLRDLVEKAHRCAGLEPIVGYFPPDRRGEVEEAIGSLAVWSEPLAGPTPSARASGLLRHLLGERAYRAAVMLGPSMAHTPRQRIFDAVHRLSTSADVVLGAPPNTPLAFVGLRGAAAPLLFEEGLSIEERTEGLRVAHRFQSGDHVCLLAPRGQHDNRRFDAPPPQFFAHVQPVLLRQHDVQQNQIRLLDSGLA